MTTIIPDTFHSENALLWTKTEHAKRWVLANLARWGWFTLVDSGVRPEFQLLAEQTGRGDAPVSMGHAVGVVTINVTEADPTELVQRREEFGERLRTMIAHFRHEIAHFIFLERLASHPDFIEEFRVLFGDERSDYAQALHRYYQYGPKEDWHDVFVTEYASTHPHEDWAETFAHLMHLTDITDSFAASGFGSPALPVPQYDAYADPDSEHLIRVATQIGLGINHVNRSMGLSDVYPFVLGPAVRKKLVFVRSWLCSPK